MNIVAAYIFYLFQQYLPEYSKYYKKRKLGIKYLKDIENSMKKILKFLTGDDCFEEKIISKEKVETYLNNVCILTTGSKNEIHNNRELSIFETIIFYNEKIDLLINEIKSNDCLWGEIDILLNIKISKLNFIIKYYSEMSIGEYSNFGKDNSVGYNLIGIELLNSRIIDSIDEYLNIYESLNEYIEKLENTKHFIFWKIIN